MKSRWAVLAACAVAAAQTVASDEVKVSARTYLPPQVRLRVRTDLVQLSVVVRDAKGHTVGGLKQSDFEILDDGKARAIDAFSMEARSVAVGETAAAAAVSLTAPPAASAPQRSILLFFDDLHADAGELRRTQDAAERFVKGELGANTRAGVYVSSEGLALDFTADTPKLAEAIEKLRPHQRVSEAGVLPCPRITPYQAYLIANNMDPSATVSALAEAAACNSNAGAVTPDIRPTRPGINSRTTVNPVEMAVQNQAQQTWEQVRVATETAFDGLGNAMSLLARTPGTRILLLVSEGFLSGLEESPREASLIDRAIRAGVVVNALDAKGMWSEPPARPPNELAETVTMAPETFHFEARSMGARNSALNAPLANFASATGGLFFHNSNDLAGGFHQLAAVPEVSYLIAFRSDPAETPGKYHKLKVRVAAGKQDIVQTRPGYFTPAPAEAADTQDALDREAFANDTRSEIPVQLSGRMGKTERGAPTLTLVIHVDLAKLKFADHDGRHVQKLHFVGSLIDAAGMPVAAKEGEMDLSLKDETMARLTASGVNASLSFSAPAAKYRVRVVVLEAGGKLAAVNQLVDLQ